MNAAVCGFDVDRGSSAVEIGRQMIGNVSLNSDRQVGADAAIHCACFQMRAVSVRNCDLNSSVGGFGLQT